MTDEQFQRLMDKLDSIERRLPMPQYVGYRPNLMVQYNPAQCAYCGGFHGGVMCPLLSPTCTGVNLT